jgi:UV DNA damage repair endonuclease
VNLSLSSKSRPLVQSASIGSARVKDCASVTQGLEFVSGLALANCQDLLPMLQWNARHGIKLMRWTRIAMHLTQCFGVAVSASYVRPQRLHPAWQVFLTSAPCLQAVF